MKRVAQEVRKEMIEKENVLVEGSSPIEPSCEQRKDLSKEGSQYIERKETPNKVEHSLPLGWVYINGWIYWVAFLLSSRKWKTACDHLFEKTNRKK